jgi:C4-dicarboxylate transporter DctM subunit
MGSLPYVMCMVAAILILCFFPGIATWLPNYLMGQAI